jgi:arylformamidase
MAQIDYEKEYDNRGRVKDHADITARRVRDAAAYREARKADATIGERYGTSSRQIIDFFPAKAGGSAAPLAMFIHGGYWHYRDPSQFSSCALGPNAQGIDVAIVGYDLCPAVTITTIIEQMRAACLHLWRKRKRRVMVYGHSAGGHLAACMLATDWKTVAPDAPQVLVPAAYAISGLFDLTPLLHVLENTDLRLKDEAEALSVSPVTWRVPSGRMFDAMVGGDESSEFLRQSRDVIAAWGKQGVATRYQEMPGANHFTIIDPLTDADSAMTNRIAELSRQVSAIKV